MSTYTANIGTTMAHEWWAGNRKRYFKLQRYLHMSVTGSKTRKAWGLGPFPSLTKARNNNG